MLYMVVETYRRGPKPVYDRFESTGRMLPDGLEYVKSWLSTDGNTCYQLMNTDDASVFDAWIEKWVDLVSFQVTEVNVSPTAT